MSTLVGSTLRGGGFWFNVVGVVFAPEDDGEDVAAHFASSYVSHAVAVAGAVVFGGVGWEGDDVFGVGV